LRDNTDDEHASAQDAPTRKTVEQGTH